MHKESLSVHGLQTYNSVFHFEKVTQHIVDVPAVSKNSLYYKQFKIKYLRYKGF